MKYLVKARLIPSKKDALLAEIARGTLGSGSVAFGEYVKNMQQARILNDGTICWIEICFCQTPLAEERLYWEKYFDLISVEAARDPSGCMDACGKMKRGCFDCACTDRLEQEMLDWGQPFLGS